jgi:hypothetical protein
MRGDIFERREKKPAFLQIGDLAQKQVATYEPNLVFRRTGQESDGFSQAV